MATSTTRLIFAYGSNMASPRLRARTPSARPIGIGQLKGHALRWHKRSVDGSGKCDAMVASGSDTVWGVVFEIDAMEKPLLDAAEGLHHGYDEKMAEIVMEQGTVRATLYCATDLDPSRRPYTWYKNFVVHGAKEHGLPEHYVRTIEAVEAIPDPDVDRGAENARILTPTRSSPAACW